MKGFHLFISFFISLVAYSQENFCSGEVKNFEIKKNEFFTGLCANNERSRGLTIYLEDNESNMAGAGFAGSYKNDMPFRGELLFDPENEDDPSYILRGEFTGEGESLRFRGDIYYGEDFVSGGSHNDDFELDGYGIQVIYEGEFDYQLGIFADAMLVGNAMWTKKNSADIVYVKYTRAGTLTDKAYLELENGEEYTLNYRSNSYRSSSKGWTQNDRASAEIIKNALSTELDEHLRFREQLQKEIDQVIEEVNSLDTEIEESFVSLAGWGTGFYVNEDTVVTNNHVVESCQSVTGLLGFERPMRQASSLNIDLSGVSAAGDWAAAIASRMGESDYVNPPGGASFLNEETFEQVRVNLWFHHYFGQCCSVTVAGTERKLSVLNDILERGTDQVRLDLLDFEIVQSKRGAVGDRDPR